MWMGRKARPTNRTPHACPGGIMACWSLTTGGRFPYVRIRLFSVPAMLRMFQPILGLCVLAWLAAPASAEISVATDFAGGSAKVLAIDQAMKTVRILPGGDPNRGWPC